MAEYKGKYQPWSHEEFMADIRVRRMSPTALKTYMMLLHEAFVCETRPNLPDDEERLELMAYCSDHEEWLSVRDVVLGMFVRKLENGEPVLVRKRLQDDWNRLQDIRESRAEAGRASAEARRRLTKVNKCSTFEHKEVSKEVSKEREEKEESDPLSLQNQDGQHEQGDDMNLKGLKTAVAATAAKYGAKAGGNNGSWDKTKTLADAYGSSAFLQEFEKYMGEEQGGDFPYGALAGFLYVAEDRLASDPIATTGNAKDPAVVALARELSYLSDGAVTFVDKQRSRLSEVLADFSAGEIKSAFKVWVDAQDLNDPKNVSFLAGKFVQIADGLCYTARKRKQEAEQAKTDRGAAVARLQEEAEVNRQAREKMKQTEDVDPLGLFDEGVA